MFFLKRWNTQENRLNNNVKYSNFFVSNSGSSTSINKYNITYHTSIYPISIEIKLFLHLQAKTFHIQNRYFLLTITK